MQKNFPKCSPDLNVVEWFWARLKERLEQRAPVKCETHKAFLVRLRHIVQWMNENLHEEMLQMCLSMHDRADEVIARLGGKISF